MSGKQRFNFAELDSESTDLDLVIVPTAIFNVPSARQRPMSPVL